MTNLMGLSDATTLAMHAMAILAGEGNMLVSNHQMAVELGASEHHLAKVMQRLTKAGLVDSFRGPKGGFRLGKPSDKISLLKIYEVMDGPFKMDNCLLGKRVCKRGNCIFCNIPEKLQNEIKNHFAKTTLNLIVN